MDGTELAKVSHPLLDRIYERMCASKNATSCPFRLHERRLGLAEVVERGVRVLVERPRVVDPGLSPPGVHGPVRRIARRDQEGPRCATEIRRRVLRAPGDVHERGARRRAEE